MGYIIPVDRFQYNDYHNRVAKEKTNIEPVNRSFKAVLEKNYEEVTSESDRQIPSFYKNIPLRPQINNVAEFTYAEITGKGRMFSESI